ncbi:MAG TPA: hypothetical protein VF783_25160 [Terriglobales bacterium]
MSCRNWFLICSTFVLLFVAVFAAAQRPLSSERRPPVDVAGHWVIAAKNWNGVLNTKTVDPEQNGDSITGHLKGPDQSGGLEGSVNGHHIVFRIKTKHPLTFRGQADGDTMTGIYHLMGKEGEFHAERTASK